MIFRKFAGGHVGPQFSVDLDTHAAPLQPSAGHCGGCRGVLERRRRQQRPTGGAEGPRDATTTVASALGAIAIFECHKLEQRAPKARALQRDRATPQNAIAWFVVNCWLWLKENTMVVDVGW